MSRMTFSLSKNGCDPWFAAILYSSEAMIYSVCGPGPTSSMSLIHHPRRSDSEVRFLSR